MDGHPIESPIYSSDHAALTTWNTPLWTAPRSSASRLPITTSPRRPDPKMGNKQTADTKRASRLAKQVGGGADAVKASPKIMHILGKGPRTSGGDVATPRLQPKSRLAENTSPESAEYKTPKSSSESVSTAVYMDADLESRKSPVKKQSPVSNKARAANLILDIEPIRLRDDGNGSVISEDTWANDTFQAMLKSTAAKHEFLHSNTSLNKGATSRSYSMGQTPLSPTSMQGLPLRTATSPTSVNQTYATVSDSRDSVFCPPELPLDAINANGGGVNGSQASLGSSILSRADRNRFTISRHKKIELSDLSLGGVASVQPTKDKEPRRYSSSTSEVLGSNSVLKRVASLTQSNNKLTKDESKVRTQPDKPDFTALDKFEGQMLLTWLLSSVDCNNNRREIQQICNNLCCHLVSTGLIKSLESPGASTFKPNLMYQWSTVQRSVVLQSPETPSVPIDKLVELGSMQTQIQQLEMQVEKYKTLADLQDLTKRAQLGSDSQFRSTVDTGSLTDNPLMKTTETDTDYLRLLNRTVGVQTLLVSMDKAATVDCCTATEPLETSEVIISIKLNQSTSTENLNDQNASSIHSVITCDAETMTDLCATETQMSSTSQVPPASPLPELGPAPPPPPLPLDGFGSPPPPPPMMTESFAPPVGPPPPPPLNMGAPLPPPLPGGPPPPPAPGGPPLPPPIGGSPIPPGAPPAPSGPSPLPPPPVGGWNTSQELRKNPIIPKAPMKPLYWTRIQLMGVMVEKESMWKDMDDSEVADCIDEFVEMFSRKVVERKLCQRKSPQPSRYQAAKLLDAKRSQQVGILFSSLRLDVAEVENAVLNLDTSTLELEALRAIYEVRATDEEYRSIKCHVESCPEMPLDKPEQFLLDLSDIPHFAERVACLMFRSNFSENVNSIEARLQTLRQVCTSLTSSKTLRNVVSLVLTLGNYMNGGNRQRGQADGFGLDILPKLKDVKSSDGSFTLLHYVVRAYIRKFDPENAGTEHALLPIPEPGDVHRAAQVKFDDLQAEVTKITNELVACERRVRKVTEESKPEHLQPFKEKMENFLEHAKKDGEEQQELLSECQITFHNVMDFYQWQPRTTGSDPVQPKDFFSVWAQFSADFKDVWVREQQKVYKQKAVELQKKIRKMKEDTKMATKQKEAKGLKAKLLGRRKN